MKTQINDIYEEIGKKVYEKHIREEDICIKKDLEEQCTKIDVLSDEIDSLLKECLTLKDKKQCQKCYKEIEKDDKFCPNCGEKQTEEPRQEIEVEEKLENTEVEEDKAMEKQVVIEELEQNIENQENREESKQEATEDEKTNLERTVEIESNVKIVVQRVNEAEVKVEGKIVGKIKKGFLVLLGVTHNDTKEQADYLVKKLCKLRVFTDENDKMNLGLKDIQGELLIVSQFTLYADCSQGNRPSFTEAAKPEQANELYEYFCSECEKNDIHVEKGIFGADIKVSLLNDGPVTIIIEK